MAVKDDLGKDRPVGAAEGGGSQAVAFRSLSWGGARRITGNREGADVKFRHRQMFGRHPCLVCARRTVLVPLSAYVRWALEIYFRLALACEASFTTFPACWNRCIMALNKTEHPEQKRMRYRKYYVACPSAEDISTG